ncbi:MAG: efflux RND transporter periplasmic adaptor subunit [Microcoleus vaginatus WJT46-NPBG5]|jgi:HlyD family secretion protein|nr:efflux RND transporter periplasmic adaptor subunit [Microcoleus vaginatus WJT46-NPBG5]
MGQKDKKQVTAGIKWIMVSAVLALASAGGWLVYAQLLNRPSDPVPVRLIDVKQDNVESTINESGTVELGGQQTLKSPIEGAVDKVLVRQGERVESGEQLLVLRNPERQTSLSSQQSKIREQEIILASNRQKVLEATAQLNAAQKALQDIVSRRDNTKQISLNEQQLVREKQQLALASSRQKVLDAKESLASTQRELRELEELDRRGFIAKRELRDQEETVRNAESALRQAQSQVNTDIIEQQRLQLEIQKIEEEFQDKAEEDRSQLQQAEASEREAAAALRQAEAEVATTTVALQQAQLERQEIEEKLQENVVIAPINGVILDLVVKEGDGVNLSNNLLTLGDPSQEFVKLQLSTLNAARVKPNQEARISVIGPEGQTFTGQVVSLSPLAGAGTQNSQQQSSEAAQATVPAAVRLSTPSGKLIPGSQVNVEIVLDARQNVVVLDTEAIQREGPLPFVWVRDTQGKAQKRPVKLGLEGLVTVEVKSGLRPGDQVVVPPPEAALEAGMPVTPEVEPPNPKNGKGKPRTKK